MFNSLDTGKFINPHQIGGIEQYVIDDARAAACALCVNTGGGLRYRVLVDRGLDIDQAFFNDRGLAFLTHKGVTPPGARAGAGRRLAQDVPRRAADELRAVQRRPAGHRCRRGFAAARRPLQHACGG